MSCGASFGKRATRPISGLASRNDSIPSLNLPYELSNLEALLGAGPFTWLADEIARRLGLADPRGGGVRDVSVASRSKDRLGWGSGSAIPARDELAPLLKN